MNEIASIVIPSYRNFDYIYESIDSALMQDYAAIEIIICDDCSNNFPKAEIINYIEKNKCENIVSYNIYSNETNLGTVKNLNRAVKSAKGKYILELSSDDIFYESSTVSKVVERLKSSNGIITCRRVLFNEQGNIRLVPSDKAIEIIKKYDQYFAFASGEHYELASGSCTYYTKEFFLKNNGYDERLRLLEDWSFYLKITKHTKIETAYDIISIRYRYGGVSSKKNLVLENDYSLMMKNAISSDNKWIINRYLKFNSKRMKKGGWIAHILYIDLVIRRVIYLLKMKKLSK